jgi:Family of unknown function (DUF5764)
MSPKDSMKGRGKDSSKKERLILMDLLNESERRYTKKLCQAMIPVMIEAFWEIWLESKKVSQGKNTTKVFQELLRDVKTWNASISNKNTEAIIKNSSIFPSLLAAVFVIQVKILSSIRTDKKQKKICIKLPGNDIFVQRCYENCARNLYTDPLIITETNTDEFRKSELFKRFTSEIADVIEELVPTAEILNTYLPLPAAGEDFDLEHEEEEPIEEEEGAEEEVPNVDEPTIPGMEFGKTPEGVDTTVTVNNTLTPPNIPGATPGETPVDQNLFDDAPTGPPRGTPTRIQKIGQ